MDKNVLRNVILDQRQVIEEAEICPRSYELEDNVCYVLVGLRRAGKSTLLYSKVRDYLKEGISWDQIIYINFEDERLAEFKSCDFQDILILKNEMTTKKAFFFFDEIQNIDGWEMFARRLADSNETVCITGSNSKTLSSEVAAKLGGRYIAKDILPYDFEEFIKASSIKVDESTKSKGQIGSKFQEFLKFGGLPAILKFKDKREYLTSVYEKALLNDVLIHNNIRNEQYMKILVKKIAESVKDELSFTKLNNIMKTIGFSTSKDTVINYVSFLMNANLIFSVKNYYASFVDKESTPKYYFIDNGILNLFLNEKEGKLFENLVAVALKRYGKDFYYLKNARTSIDIDFYIPDDDIAIQVATTISDPNTFERETNSLIKLANIQNNTRLFILTLDEEKSIDIGNQRKIEILPLSKVLLNCFKRKDNSFLSIGKL